MPQMHQEEEARMTFQEGINSSTCIIPQCKVIYKEHAEGVKPHAAFIQWVYVRQNSCSQSCTVSDKLNTRRIKVSNESVQCWAFKTLVENQEIIWNMVYKCRNNIASSYIQNFLFDMGWSPHLDTNKKNYFYLDVKNSKFSNASPC